MRRAGLYQIIKQLNLTVSCQENDNQETHWGIGLRYEQLNRKNHLAVTSLSSCVDLNFWYGEHC